MTTIPHNLAVTVLMGLLAVHLAGNTAKGALVLNVDLNTQAYLLNNSASDILIDGYRISSAAGSLNPTAWTSLQDGGFDGGTWLEVGMSPNELSEGVLELNSLIPAGANIPLGALFNELVNVEDLVLQYHLNGAEPEDLVLGAVNYFESVGLLGDFNGDNVVDAADYTVWRNNVGSNVPLNNDNDLGVPVGAAHYQLWKSNFGASTPGSLLTANAVPEPAAVWTLLFAACLVSIFTAGGWRSRQWSALTSIALVRSPNTPKRTSSRSLQLRHHSRLKTSS